MKSNYFLPLFWRSFTLFLVLALLVLSVLTPISARAQDQNFAKNSLVLQEGKDHYRVIPYIYVTKDSETPLDFDNYKKFIHRHLAGERGERVQGPILNLGSSSMPHWIVFAVHNKSHTEKWVLSFGQHIDGRIGLLNDIFVYDHFSKEIYVDTLSLSNTPYAASQKLNGTSLTLDIPRGKKTLVFAYIVPKAGMPSTLAPEIITESAYIHRNSDFFSQTRVIGFFFILVVGVFLATILFRQMWSSALFVLYYVVLLFLFYDQNDFIQNDFFLAAHMPGVLFNLTAFLGLFMSKCFFAIGKLQHFQSRIMTALSILLILSTVWATSFLADDSGLQITVMYLPPLCVFFFLSMLALAYGYTELPEGYQIAAGWMIVFAGACTSFISLMNIFTPSLFLLNSYWYALIIQGFLFLTALTTRVLLEERSFILKKEKQKQDFDSIKNITVSKDASENSRLLRMIEYEREVMTELRERELQQNQKMKAAKEEADQANNAKSAFLAVVSHEIRTPMTGVMGMVKLLLETNLNKKQKEYAQTLQDSGDGMLLLLNDILDFEKIESGNMDMEYMDFDLHRLIQGVKTLMSAHAEVKNIHLNVDLDPDVPRFLIGDSMRLRQVILNLVGNSIKFTEKGGVIIHVTLAPSNSREKSGKMISYFIRFAIEDSGIGISKKAQVNLFNPFTQADSSVARKFGGTGLGLAISKKLIGAMGGRIEIDSIEGQGSTFFFTLSMEEGRVSVIESAEKSNKKALQKHERSMKILVVEDNEINRKLMRELLDCMGHEIMTAGSGEESLVVAGENDLDLILMDLQLPGMSGIEATKAIRTMDNPVRAAVPIIALTGNVQEKDVEQCYAANMNGHLAKPVDPKKLQDQIDKVTEGDLDNPVEFIEEKSDPYTQLTQKDIIQQDSGIEKLGGAPPDHDDDDDIAPIMAELGGGDKFSIELSEDDLDGDSFEEALGVFENEEGAENNEVFDRLMLESLRSSVGQEQFDSLLQEMLVTAKEIGMAIEKAAADRAISEIKLRAHELKGMAGNFGFTEMSALAIRIEGAAQKNELGGVQKILPALPIAHERAKAALQEFLESDD